MKQDLRTESYPHEKSTFEVAAAHSQVKYCGHRCLSSAASPAGGVGEAGRSLCTDEAASIGATVSRL